MCAAAGLIAGIISLGENASGEMEHSDARVSRGDESFSEEEAGLLTRMRQREWEGRGVRRRRGEGGREG